MGSPGVLWGEGQWAGQRGGLGDLQMLLVMEAEITQAFAVQKTIQAQHFLWWGSQTFSGLHDGVKAEPSYKFREGRNSFSDPSLVLCIHLGAHC